VPEPLVPVAAAASTQCFQGLQAMALAVAGARRAHERASAHDQSACFVVVKSRTQAASHLGLPAAGRATQARQWTVGAVAL
jgi:hypothetical protein